MGVQQSAEGLTWSPPGEAKGSVIWLHGLGADGHDFIPFAQQLAVCQRHSLRFICPHAPRLRVTLNNHQVMRAWFDVHGLTMDAFQDVPGINQSAKRINALIEAEVQRGILTDRIVLGGFSQGGMMALHCGLRYPYPLAGVMCLSGALLMAKQLPLEGHDHNKTCPIFLAHGTDDPLLSHTLGERTRSLLKDMDYPLTWRSYPMGHQLCDQEIRDCDAWLERIYSRHESAQG